MKNNKNQPTSPQIVKVVCNVNNKELDIINSPDFILLELTDGNTYKYNWFKNITISAPIRRNNCTAKTYNIGKILNFVLWSVMLLLLCFAGIKNAKRIEEYQQKIYELKIENQKSLEVLNK